MANKVYNMAGGLHSAAAYSALEDSMYGSCVATANDYVASAGTGMNVSLSKGTGLISTGLGYARRIASDAVQTIAVAAASSAAPRIDSLVAYIDNAVNPVTTVVDNTNDILKFKMVAGTAASTPVAPTAAVIQSSVGAGNPYMVLWNVKIPKGATALSGATFSDKRTIANASIADNAITSAKIASGAVTSSKIDWTTFVDKVYSATSVFNSSNKSVLTVPAGKYLITYSVRFATSGTTAWAWAPLYINGSNAGGNTAGCFMVNDGETPVVFQSKTITATANMTIGVDFEISGNIYVQSCVLSVFGIKSS